jgi:DnaJ-class molecular chaperone
MGEFYKLLNVQRSATNIEIKAAYRQLAKELHPDVNNGSAVKTARFTKIASAYEILSNDMLRAKYDRTLGGSSDFSDRPKPRPSTTARPFNPGRYATPHAYAHAHTTPSSSSSSKEHPAAAEARRKRAAESQGGKAKFDTDEWESNHYGDEAYDNKSTARRKSSWMDLVNNKHQSYFAKKREEQIKKERDAFNAQSAADEEQHKRSAGTNLQQKREARRAGVKEEDSTCSVS